MNASIPLITWLYLLCLLLLWLLLAGALAGLLKLVRIRSFLIFVTLGPPIGFVWLVTSNMALDLLKPTTGTDIWPDIGSFIAGISVSYLFGFVPAVLSSSLVHLIRRHMPQSEWLYVLLVGVVIGLAYWAWLNFDLIYPDQDFDVLDLFKVISVCLVPTLVCWRLSRWVDKSAKLHH